TEHCLRCPVIVALPRGAAADIGKEAIEGVAEAARHRREVLDPAVIGNTGLMYAGMRAGRIGEANVTLDADHKRTGKLIIASGLCAADHALDRVLAEELAEEITAGRAVDPLLIVPQAAHVTACETARPTPCRRDRRRRLHRKAQISRHGRLRQRD